jgi:hypothetical protein
MTRSPQSFKGTLRTLKDVFLCMPCMPIKTEWHMTHGVKLADHLHMAYKFGLLSQGYYH